MALRLDLDQNAPLEGVKTVVMQAISSLTPQQSCGELFDRPLESYLSEMFDAAISSDPKALKKTVKTMHAAMISSTCIAEIYVPAVARRFGDAWVADTLDFGRVTIGSARLQGLLRNLERSWVLHSKSGEKSPPSLLVGVPAGYQHTLGATVLAGQLRHRGMAVILDLELTAAGLKEHFLNQHLSGVLLSASAGDDLATFCELVNITHNHNRDTPVIIGGSILEQVDNMKQLTGADLVTNKVEDVLRYCDARHVAQDDTLALNQEVK